ncbi:MAG: hypothetical protein RL629_571, partial [Pseudomonadota bacterium]
MTLKSSGPDSEVNAISLVQRLKQPKALLAPGVYDA